METLTRRQALFVGEYLVDFNGTNAAIRAGYSPHSADRLASDTLRKPKIIEAINQAMVQREKRLQLRQDAVLLELAALGFSDITEYVDFGPNGITIKDSKELKNTVAIQEVIEKEFKGVKEVRIKLHDKVRPLEALLKHLSSGAAQSSYNVPDVNVNVSVINQVNQIDLSRFSIEELEQIERTSAILEQRSALPSIDAGPRADEVKGTEGEVAKELPALCRGSGTD